MWISSGSANGLLYTLVIPNIITNNIPRGVAHLPEVWHTARLVRNNIMATLVTDVIASHPQVVVLRCL